MNKLLGDKLAKEKLTIKNRYLAGEAVPSIAREYGVTERNIYYHLGKLSPEDKGLHIKNSSLRKMVGQEAELSTKSVEAPRSNFKVEICSNFNSSSEVSDQCAVCGFSYQSHLDKIKEGLSHA